LSITSRTRETVSSTAKGDARREAILATVRRLLATRRFAEFTVAEITEQAGITRSAFYFYFPSKAAAVAALLEDIAGDMLRLASSWYLGGPGPAERRLRDGMRASIKAWRGNAVLLAAILDVAAIDAPTAQLWGGFIHGFVVRVTQRIDHDVNCAPGRRPPTAPALAGGLVRMVFALMEQDVRDLLAGGEGVPELEDVLVHVWHTTIYGETR
jgi:AcrR family transcriptional regulator